MADKDTLYIVIPVFNGWEQTRQCLDHLLASSYRDIHIIVVDHGSTDATKSEIGNYSAVQHLTASDTLWWTGATNVGIKSAMGQGASRIMLLNNDCYVTPDTIKTMMSHARDHPEAVIAPLQQSWPGGKTLPWKLTTCFTLGFPTLALPGATGKSAEILARARLIVGGRGVVIPVAVLQQVGLFDEDILPHYGADHDFYLRCRQQQVPLYVAMDTVIDIDQARTTVSRNLGALSWRDFRLTLRDKRSHRNREVLAALFRRYYPVPALSFIGVFLNLSRYFFVYLVKRAIFALRNLLPR